MQISLALSTVRDCEGSTSARRVAVGTSDLTWFRFVRSCHPLLSAQQPIQRLPQHTFLASEASHAVLWVSQCVPGSPPLFSLPMPKPAHHIPGHSLLSASITRHIPAAPHAHSVLRSILRRRLPSVTSAATAAVVVFTAALRPRKGPPGTCSGRVMMSSSAGGISAGAGGTRALLIGR